MKLKSSQKLIRETKTLIRLQAFLRNEVGLKEELSAKELKILSSILKNKKFRKSE